MRYTAKQDWIIPFVTDKKVLDLGCVEHDISRTKKEGWLHGIIHKYARSVVGVDCLPGDIAALKEQGYHVVCANVETMELGDTFDIVVAGDIIEHVSNAGQFIKRVSDHLAPGGLFLVTTPNPVHLTRFVQLLIYRRVGVNREHTCWYTRQTLNELAVRYGLEIVDVAYVDNTAQYYSFWWSPILALNYLLCLARPEFCETLCFILKKRAE